MNRGYLWFSVFFLRQSVWSNSQNCIAICISFSFKNSVNLNSEEKGGRVWSMYIQGRDILLGITHGFFLLVDMRGNAWINVISMACQLKLVPSCYNPWIFFYFILLDLSALMLPFEEKNKVWWYRVCKYKCGKKAASYFLFWLDFFLIFVNKFVSHSFFSQ